MKRACLALSLVAAAGCGDPATNAGNARTANGAPEFALESGDGAAPRQRHPAEDEASEPTDATTQRSDAPGPRTAVGGVRAMRIDGLIELKGDPDAEVLELRSTRKWVFPDRLQLTWQPEGAPAMDRSRWQRFGTRVWTFEPRVVEPTPLTVDEARREVAVLDALYRAALLWPADFAWDDASAPACRAVLDDPLAPDVELRARDDGGSRTITAHVGERELARIVAHGRYDHPSLVLPERVDVVLGAVSWTERFATIDPRARYDDRLFLAGTGASLDAAASGEDVADADGSGSANPVVREIDALVPRPTRRIDFDPPLAELGTATKRARTALADLEADLREGAVIALELDASSRVTAALVELRPRDEVPEGFEPGRSGSARSAVLAHLDSAELARVRALLEPDGPADAPIGWAPYLVELESGWNLVVPAVP